jgi:uncharacterized protein (TIGR02598 family)
MKRTLSLFSQNSIRPAGFCQSTQAINTRLGFSLVEVVISLSIVSFALIAILGILPLGIASLRDSNTDTTTSLVLPQVRGLILGEDHSAGQTFGPYYFDASSSYIGIKTKPDDPNDNRTAYYRVDLLIDQPTAPLRGKELVNSDVLVCVAEITWPADISGNVPQDSNGNARNSQIFSFFVTPLTGTGWQSLGSAPTSTFMPKVEL